MRAELRRLRCLSTPDMSLDAFAPAGDFCVFVEADIGPAGEAGEELFTVRVCTAGGVADLDLVKGYRWLRQTLLVAAWQPDIVERSIRDLCLHAEGADWHEIATKLNRWMAWEFEDYAP